MIFEKNEGPDAFVAGHYLYRRDMAQMVPIPIRIWYGVPTDPETGEDLDRSPRWQIEIRGKIYGSQDPPYLGGYEVDEEKLFRLWPKCMRWPITAEEYRFHIDRHRWATENDETDPYGGDIRIDPLTAPLD